ncbi:MAG: peptidase propeptide domain-containing protein [Methanobacteriales archaeon Met13]
MINSKIIISVIIVMLIGVAAAGYQITSTTPGLWKPLQSQSQDISPADSGTSSGSSPSTSGSSSPSEQSSGSGSVNVKFTSTEAKTAAQEFIKEPGATAGVPKLLNMNGKQTYVVPVIMNGKQVGEIYIDPQTGKNIGGAGGVLYD